MIDYGKFSKSLKQLELQYANYLDAQHRDTLTDLDKEGIAESVIQRFETCYDCLWKILKRHLAEVLGVPEMPNSPKPIFRIAHENKLFASSLEEWLDGGAYPAVRPEVVLDTAITFPSKEILEHFSGQVAPLFALFAENEAQSRTLATLRDALLPKLLSGEIRVGDAENKIMEITAC